VRQEQPFFSIVIPTYDRPRQLAACLQSLSRLNYPRDRFEVIVVDDGSETPPEAVVASFCDHLDLMLLTQAHAGPAAARNTGAARAKGEFLAFTDDDCAPAADWLQVLAARFAGASDCAIGGRTLNALSDNLCSTASQLLIAYLYAYYNADPDRARFFASNNLAMPADRFHAIGGFCTTYTRSAAEDRELCDRWLHHGYRMIYVPEALIYHAHALTFRIFWRQHFNYGCGAFGFRQARAQHAREPISLEPRGFYLDLLRYPFSQARGWRALLLAALLVMSQVAHVVGFLWKGMNHKRVYEEADAQCRTQ
jgi:glycosyltransferase involved in cell wall biosynthesis